MKSKGYLPRSLTLISALLFLVGASVAQSFHFAPIDVPCTACPGGIARQTIAQGINPRGDTVGTYKDAANQQHGFLLSKGQFTTIDFPGAVATIARGIGPSGDIVGSYTAPAGSSAECQVITSPACNHGFLYSGGTFSTLQFGNHPGAFAQRITPDGSIYGCLHDMDVMGSMFGAAWTTFGDISLTAGGGELTDANRAIPASMNNGSTPDGHTIVGHFTDMATNLTHGFMVQNGDLQVYDVPGSILTQIWDVNPGRAFVGTYVASNGKRHGFLQLPDGSAPINVDYPAATATIAFGMNPGGTIVGQYIDTSGRIHGFLAVPPEE